jgi:hypothetical protein
MAKGDMFWNNVKRRSSLKAAEAAGEIADSLEVRMALVKQMEAGEITLEQMQAELSAIKRSAKKHGQTTRSKAFRL